MASTTIVALTLLESDISSVIIVEIVRNKRAMLIIVAITNNALFLFMEFSCVIVLKNFF